MLDVQDMHAYYGKSHILQGVNLRVNKGEIVALLGRNVVGRSTTCKAIMGEVTPKGIVRFNGEDIAGKPAFEVANLGIGYVPENRDIFPGRPPSKPNPWAQAWSKRRAGASVFGKYVCDVFQFA